MELLVRKLYYKFCNERKKYPIEFKRRQPNKRKRLLRDEELTIINSEQRSNDFHHSSLDHLMHLWTNVHQSSSSSNSLSPSPPLNLSMSNISVE